MKTLVIKLTDEEYKQLEEEANKQGFAILSYYVKYKLLSQSPSDGINNSTTNVTQNIDEITKKLERKIQDMVNPFTAEVENLKQRVADLSEKIDEIESKKNEEVEVKHEKHQYPQQPSGEKKKTAMDILKSQGAIYESEVKLKNPDLFFEKIEKQGGKVLYTEKERIAVDVDFFNNFVKKLSDIHTSDDMEAQKYLTKQEHKLFQKLRQLGIIYFDNNIKAWKLSGI
ncbi:CopG family transcriptional regulator [Acidianus sp. HS-5]|uniref:CopG family transcriptional regulator n=1 Tax=Acidianus sp. HS-5 TaxID=2886040 RepID=UPI001F2ECB9A|nr:CopG family transcriptional regulator [Acidianus sp. HS-5]BDC19099.1 hypothetical protein HS5_19890 [Acidianus sp. HS-5]